MSETTKIIIKGNKLKTLEEIELSRNKVLAESVIKENITKIINTLFREIYKEIHKWNHRSMGKLVITESKLIDLQNNYLKNTSIILPVVHNGKEKKN